MSPLCINSLREQMDEWRWSHQLVLNTGATKVSTTLKYELQSCSAFRFYVAFLNSHGYAALQEDLHGCAERGVTGRVLVSRYQNFTDPHALRQLLAMPHIDLRIEEERPMHAKGWFFEHGQEERYLIGSSNWTDSGLSVNQELNVMCRTAKGAALQKGVGALFDQVFDRGTPVTEAYCRWYESVWRPLPNYPTARSHFEQAADNTGLPVVQPDLPVPNAMQREGLDALNALVKRGERKALVISATGTGKTYLSAFFARDLQAKRVLFVVHRERIARQAMASFRHVHGRSRSYGLYIGAESDTESDFIFSTVQTLSRPNRLRRFDPNDFDCIILDESHRAGAETYLRFLRHFRPQFLLGMTATPERTDGQDIFRLYDHNVAFEIRLQRALKEGLLCPFHYYGVSDLTLNGEVLKDKSDFAKLTSATRVRHIVRTLEKYSCCEPRVRGLMFCSRTDEAIRLSEALNGEGLRTTALTGAHAEPDRERAIERLELPGTHIEALDYILTVDIFNEGVDIPTVNKVVMLRPTQSAIIFVQQLGRGLRKVKGQDKYLTVIDFIGNYENNWLIPAALYGDTSWNKDKLRQLALSGNDLIPGSSTINFDRVAKERIFESINKARNAQVRELKLDFKAMQQRLGRTPMMMDWHHQGARDPRLFARAVQASYAHFVVKYFGDGAPAFRQSELGAMEVWSSHVMNGTSPEEPALMKLVLAQGGASVEEVLVELRDLGFPSTEERVLAAAHALNLGFSRIRTPSGMSPAAAKWGGAWLCSAGRRWEAGPQLASMGEGAKEWLADLASFSLRIFLSEATPEKWRNGFVLGQKYTRTDVFRILGHPVNPVAQNVGGYLISADPTHCPIFVTYHKEDGISATTKYEDALVNPETMHWFTKSNRSLKSPDVQFFRRMSERGDGRLPLFVKKSDSEGIDFYFLGDVRPVAGTLKADRMPGASGAPGSSVVRMDLKLEDPVPLALFEYLRKG